MAEERFEFGRNWEDFLAIGLDESRIAAACEGLTRLLAGESLAGKSFLDIGSGSGLMSLAAARLGAERLFSFDYDAHSVAATRSVREREGIGEERWRITQGSVLDADFMAAIEPADVVYSWGVLHHTGDMWRAIEMAAAKVAPGGLFVIALYNRVTGLSPFNSRLWWHIKRTYVRSPQPIRTLLVAAYVVASMVPKLLAFRNPLRIMREYRRNRGMSYWHDARDWLGGFPFEAATAGEVFTAIHGQYGLNLVCLNSTNGAGCNEFTFR
jgi:2-polyprenyl-6-hydroxyphenyl methylase/3-demethylubiquinone-9 3-methyltransferase